MDVERLLDACSDVDGCWIPPHGKGFSRDTRGYVNGYDPATQRSLHAYRQTYEYLIGDIPEGLHLDHLCRNASCVNPYHLDPVTPKVNAQRRSLLTRCNADGHVRKVRPNGKTFCHTCRMERQRIRRSERIR